MQVQPTPDISDTHTFAATGPTLRVAEDIHTACIAVLEFSSMCLVSSVIVLIYLCIRKLLVTIMM